MEKLIDIFQATIKEETLLPGRTDSMREFDDILRQMEKLGAHKKPTYNLPQPDTIGKSYYSMLNISNGNL